MWVHEHHIDRDPDHQGARKSGTFNKGRFREGQPVQLCSSAWTTGQMRAASAA